MAELSGPCPPGTYPVVVIGSGAGALQTAYSLRALGVRHAVISADEGPGGMFRRFPIFERLITWTKVHAPADPTSPGFERYDWNSLLGAEPEHRGLVAAGMEPGRSYFPTRAEMQRGLVDFAERTGLEVRYGCSWTGTECDGDGFTVHTSDGDYHADAIVVAVGMTTPWKPPIPGIESVPHYVDTKRAEEYAGKRVFIAGKRNSGFEIANALLPWASQIVLGSPRPSRLSIVARTTAAARAPYLQPYEDHVLGGGHLVLDAVIDRIERTADGYRVHCTGTTRPGPLVLDVDEVIAATGFTTPMQDLQSVGVATFSQGRLPAQTPFWESATAPGVYFAGSITQGSIGLKKYGIPSNSGAVHGFRYNARVLAEHLAETRFGVRIARPEIAPDDVAAHLLNVATRAPELWNQQSYLARVVRKREDGTLVDGGVEPLQHFVDASGPDAAAITIETDADGDIHPALYVRVRGETTEHLLPSDPLLRYDGGTHRAVVADRVRPLVG